MNSKLKPKNKLFADFYIKTNNGTEAAILAGYSKNSARITASKLLTNTNIIEYIENKRKKIQEKIDFDIDKIIQEMAKIGFFNIIDYVDDNGLVDVQKLKKNPIASAAISEIVVETKTTKWGENTTVKLKSSDKISALHKLGVHLGGFKTTTKHEGGLTLEQILTKSWENDGNS